jgi:hypothetical protein
MMRNAYLEEVCLNCITGSKKGPESENGKITAENNIDCIFIKR